MQANYLIGVLLIIALPIFFWRAWVGLKLNEQKERQESQARLIRHRHQAATDLDKSPGESEI